MKVQNSPPNDRDFLSSGIASLLLSLGVLLFCGCKNEDSIKGQVQLELKQGFIEAKATHIQFSGRVKGTFPRPCGTNDDAICSVSVTIVGKDSKGDIVTKEVPATVRVKCVPGAEYELDCEDPVLLQVPTDLTAFKGEYDDGGGNKGALQIVAGLSRIRTGAQEFIDSEAGNQIVVVSFPDEAPTGTYTIRLRFNVATVRPIDIKPIFAIRAGIGINTLYVPVLPVVGSFQEALAFTIPVSQTLEPLLPSSELLRSSDLEIDFRAVPILEILNTAVRQVMLKWDASSVGYRLQRASRLSPAVWTNVQTPPVVQNGQNTVVDSTGNISFYRLEKDIP